VSPVRFFGGVRGETTSVGVGRRRNRVVFVDDGSIHQRIRAPAEPMEADELSTSDVHGLARPRLSVPLRTLRSPTARGHST